jgi:hypothetical protein
VIASPVNELRTPSMDLPSGALSLLAKTFSREKAQNNAKRSKIRSLEPFFILLLRPLAPFRG